jgi:hypothetical protein
MGGIFGVQKGHGKLLVKFYKNWLHIIWTIPFDFKSSLNFGAFLAFFTMSSHICSRFIRCAKYSLDMNETFI